MSEYLIGDDIEFGYEVSQGEETYTFQEGNKLVVLFYNAEVDDAFCLSQVIEVKEPTSKVKVEIDRVHLQHIKVGRYILEIKLVNDEKVHTLNQEIVLAKESKVI